jgi:transcriptional regulator with XRE-family HTH domain
MEPASSIQIESYNDIGVSLKRAREEMQMSLDQAARLLHIRTRYLDALEQGRLNELPGLTYTRGYLMAYASFLGLDKEEVLRRFEEVEATLANKHIYFPQVFSKEKTPNHYLVFGPLLLAFLGYIVWAVFVKISADIPSMVDKMPEKPTIGLKHTYNYTSCLYEQEALYPVCTNSALLAVDLLPLGLRMQSVMEFPLLPLVADNDE